MERWIAIGKAPGWDDLKRFSQEMKDTSQWRVDLRTTITSVYALGDGRMIAECHGPAKADFEAWLSKKGWAVESITPIQHIAKTGEIWKVA